MQLIRFVLGELIKGLIMGEFIWGRRKKDLQTGSRGERIRQSSGSIREV